MNIDLDTWIISDTHFGHYNMIKLCGRPLNFNEKIINSWNRKVKNGDTVLHLGDLAIFFGPTRDMWLKMAGRLPGFKYLVKGNHDKLTDVEYLYAGFKVFPRFVKRFNGTRYLFSHEPQEPDYHWDFNIHGHMHGQKHHAEDYDFELGPNHIDVGVDVLGYAPIKLGEILENIKA